jgi:hypothetical protein
MCCLRWRAATAALVLRRQVAAWLIAVIIPNIPRDGALDDGLAEPVEQGPTTAIDESR